jgi:hypothetical protein
MAGIVGVVTAQRCVAQSPSLWFFLYEEKGNRGARTGNV